MSYLFYYLFRDLFYLIIAIIFVVVLLSIFTSFDFLTRFNFLVISSGSMEPALEIGDLAVLNISATQIGRNDIVTFKDPSGSGFFITHRVKNIYQEGETVLVQTKGDANNALDEWQLGPGDIKGKIILAFPLLGYVLEFTKTFSGFVVLVIIPAVIIIANELAKIKIYLNAKGGEINTQ